jgi:hypothetical protein
VTTDRAEQLAIAITEDPDIGVNQRFFIEDVLAAIDADPEAYGDALLTDEAYCDACVAGNCRTPHQQVQQ